MAAETELKLRLSSADARRVARLGLLRGIPPTTQQLENVYYDTPDHALASQKTALRHRRIGDTWLITVKTAEQATGGLSTRPEWEYPCAPGELDFSGVDLPALREQLEMLRPVLVPLFATNFRRRHWLLSPRPDLAVELALDEGEILARPPGHDGAPLSRPICELELELKAGPPLALLEIALELAARLSLMPENESKAQRGQRLYRGVADTPCEAKASRLDAGLPPRAAFQRLAHDCLNHFLANAEGVRLGDDPEYIHQARVALRRLRALLRVFAPLLPADFVATYSEGWRTFANQLGEARDYDVLSEETLPAICRQHEDNDRLDAFVEYVQASRLKAREAARSHFGQPALGQLTLRFLADLARLPEGNDGPTLKTFARERLEKRLRRIRRELVGIEQQSVDDLHRLRIQFKRLRYGVEFFSALYPADKIETYGAKLKSIQDSLGRIIDFERALAIEAKAPAAVRCEFIAGWLAASMQALIGGLPKVARRFGAQAAPWEDKSNKQRKSK